MNGLWYLPVTKELGGSVYDLHTDYRRILEIFQVLEDPDIPQILRWRIAMGLFYVQPVPPRLWQEAMEYLSYFLRAGQEDRPAPKLLDWQQDADAILAGVNQAAGREVRAEPYLHWWTFLSWFHAMGQGQLSTLVCIRDKLRRGQKLEAWEKDFYRQNKKRVDLKPRYSAQELAQQQRLRQLLGENGKR